MAWGAAAVQAGVIVTTADGQGADTYVQGNDSGPYGGGTSMQVKYGSGGNHPTYTRKAYFRFDLTGVPYPTITSAALTLTIVDTGAGTTGAGALWDFSVYGLTDEPGDGWDEATMKWSGAPASTADAPQVDLAKATLLGTFQLTGKGTLGGTVSISGSNLASFLNSDTNDRATFILVRDTAEFGGNSYVHGFASKEHATYAAPTLELVPEPATLVLVGLGAAAALAGRRRQRLGA